MDGRTDGQTDRHDHTKIYNILVEVATVNHPIVVERAILPLYKVTDLPFALCPITPALT